MLNMSQSDYTRLFISKPIALRLLYLLTYFTLRAYCLFYNLFCIKRLLSSNSTYFRYFTSRFTRTIHVIHRYAGCLSLHASCILARAILLPCAIRRGHSRRSQALVPMVLPTYGNLVQISFTV